MNQTEKQRGLLITFEGIDGCGKSTQVREVAKWIEGSGILPAGSKIVMTREPCDSLGIRELVLNSKGKIDRRTELMLMMASRAQHVAEVIAPALKSGHWVLCDRYYGSSLAYQGVGRGLGYRAVAQAHQAATGGSLGGLLPDLELIIDVPLDEAIRRMGVRAGESDRFEREGRQFSERLVHAFNQLSEPGFKEYHDYITLRIDGTLPPNEVTEKCGETIMNFYLWLMSAQAPANVEAMGKGPKQ